MNTDMQNALSKFRAYQRDITSLPTRSAAVLADFPDAVVVVDAAERIVFANETSGRLFDCETCQLVGLSLRDLMPSWRRSTFEIDVQTAGVSQCCWAKSMSGSDLPVEVTSSSVQILESTYLVICIRDATSNYERLTGLESVVDNMSLVIAHLEELVNADPLTELLNRRGIESVLVRELAFAQRNHTDLLAALLDLDDFKSINDKHGHNVGDVVLKAVACTLKQTVRGCDWLSRVGGDEFLILLPATSLIEGAKAAERVRMRLCAITVPLPEGDLHVTASLGLVSLSMELSSIEEVLEASASVLKASKRDGKNRITIGGGSRKDQEALCNVNQLLVDSDKFHAVSQPIHLLADQSVVGYELLSRGPKGLLEFPSDFFRVSRENKILTTVDLHCLKACLAHCCQLPANSRLHLNLFPSTIIDVPTEHLLALLQQGSHQFCIELSERLLFSDSTLLLTKMQLLKEAGILLAVDDVGFGSSSLEALILLEPDIIKLETTFLRSVVSESSRYKSLLRFVDVARALGAAVIAEGIETEEHLEVALELGITMGQGWFWGAAA
jgi:diguanylate cyclase (GGDEF)-like protein/PAS domain S-box-containing protein